MSEPTISWVGSAPAALAAKLKDPSLYAAFKTELMTKITLVALGRSLPHIPVRFGHLRRAATSRVERGGDRGFLGDNVIYAPFQHKRIPFFEMGIQDSQAQIAQLLQTSGDDFLKGMT